MFSISFVNSCCCWNHSVEQSISQKLKAAETLKQKNVTNIQSNLSVRTPLFYEQFPMSRQNSQIFSFKKNVYNADSL